MYLSKAIGYFCFSNYKNSLKNNLSSDQLIARKLIPKKMVNWGRSLHDRKITAQYSDVSSQVIEKKEGKNLSAVNEKKIKKFFLSNIKDYVNNIYECDLMAPNFFDSILPEDKKILKKNIIRCANFIAAYSPHYKTMTPEELKKAFLSTPHIPRKKLQESDLREATNFALRYLISIRKKIYFVRYQDKYTLEEVNLKKLLETHDYIAIAHRPEEIKYHNIAHNRLFITERNGNEHLISQPFDDDLPNSPHYSFDLLTADTREKILSTIAPLLSEEEDK